MNKELKQILIDFQNFLILDGQLEVSPFNAERNADVFLGKIIEEWKSIAGQMGDIILKYERAIEENSGD